MLSTHLMIGEVSKPQGIRGDRTASAVTITYCHTIAFNGIKHFCYRAVSYFRLAGCGKFTADTSVFLCCGNQFLHALFPAELFDNLDVV